MSGTWHYCLADPLDKELVSNHIVISIEGIQLPFKEQTAWCKSAITTQMQSNN
jgi:hypothetical protein